jgi:putative transcriptional regulator
MMARGCGLRLCAALALAPLLCAQSTRIRDLALGKFLVASRDLADPHFSQTVVLLVEYASDGVVGLVLNRRTAIPISRVLALKEARGRGDPVFAGGPVELAGVMALAQLAQAPAEGGRVFNDVYLLRTEAPLVKAMRTPGGRFRVFLGYAGWTAVQLRRETETGSWFIFPADAGMVFDPHPGSLWDRLIERAESRFAWSPFSAVRRSSE